MYCQGERKVNLGKPQRERVQSPWGSPPNHETFFCHEIFFEKVVKNPLTNFTEYAIMHNVKRGKVLIDGWAPSGVCLSK